MHWRIDVAEVPFVGGQLAVRMQVVVAQHEIELLLGEVGIDHAKRNHVEREVPCRIPRVFPLVRHRDDVVVEHVGPFAVAHVLALVLRQVAPGAVLLQPGVEVVVEVLLGPQHSRQRLAHDAGTVRIVANRRRSDRVVERIGFARTVREHCVEVGERPAGIVGRTRGQPQPDDVRLAGADGRLVVGRDLRSLLRNIHRRRLAVYNEAVDAVFHVR